MTHGSLFSGIGGFDLAAEWMGWENIFHCEWNEFGQKVLNYYWPKAISYDDITKTDFNIHRGRIDILTGGFPCQPYSHAGKRLGKEDDRHLWPEMLRAIREIQPTYVVGENVSGIVSWNGGLVFDEVQTDLENEGYEVQPVILPACAVNAPHRRDRVWFVAHANGSVFGQTARQGRGNTVKESRMEPGFTAKAKNGITTDSDKCTTGSPGKSGETESNRSKNNDEQKSRRRKAKLNTGCDQLLRATSHSEGSSSERKLQQRQKQGESGRCDSETITNTNGRRQPGKEYRETEPGRITEKSLSNYWQNFPTQSPICNGNDGIPSRLDGITFPKWRNESIKAGGNAIVPQIAYQIFKSLLK